MKAAGCALALVAMALAGCAGGDGGTTGTPTRPAAPSYRLDCSISNWDEPCSALASPNPSPAKTEIDIAVNPKDPRNVFVASKDLDRKASTDCVWAVGQVTKDGGRTWRTVYVGKELAQRQPTEPLHGWKCITDPILQFDLDGNLHYSLQAYQYNPANWPYLPDPTGSTVPPEMGFMFHAISTDGGESFPDIFLMHAGDQTAVFHDYMRMGLNPATGTVYTIWNQLSPGLGSIPTLVAVKRGESRSQPPVYFPNTVGATESGLGLGESGVVADRGGKVYAWLGGFNSPDEAWFAVSTDDGATFSQPERAFGFTPMRPLPSHKAANGTTYDPQYRIGTTVEIAVDLTGGPRADCLHAVWADGGADAADILARTSCDGGRTWSEPVLVSNGAHADAQWMPRVAVDGNGTVHVVYLTRAHDPLLNFVDAEWAWSRDGKEWTTQRITRASYDGNLGVHQRGFPFLGDYIGISSAATDTWMGYPDCHTGVCEIAVARATA